MMSFKNCENPKAFTEGVDENELEESIGPDLTRLGKSQAPLLKGVSRQNWKERWMRSLRD